mgnify:CR=1 FL=1
MEDDNNSMITCFRFSRFLMIFFLLFFIFNFNLFSQRISLVQYPDEVVKGDKFSVKLNLIADPDDTLYIVVSVDGDVNLTSAFLFDDSLINIEQEKTESIDLSKSGLKKLLYTRNFVFPDTFKHSSSLRSYAFVMSAKSSGDVRIKFVPIKISYDSLMFNEANVNENQIAINVKGVADKLAGLCVKFEKDGFIKFNLNDKFTAKAGFTLSFWLKTTSVNARILSLKSGTDRSFLQIGSKFGNLVFSVSNSIGKYEITLPKFISDGKWHNIIITAGQDNVLKFYIDSEKIDEIYIPNLNFFEINRPVVRIEQGLIDEVALFRLSNSELIDRLSRYFVKFDTSAVFVLKFENETINVSGNVSGVESSGVKFVPSSAPVCSPEVRVSAELKGNGINVNWEVDDPLFVDRFVLERKVGDEFYQSIYQIFASSEKRYSFFDAPVTSNAVYYYRVKRINKDGSFEFSDEVKVGIGLKKDFEILGNFPNPFNLETKIIYNLFTDTHVRLVVYDIVGREIAILVDGFQTAGRHEIVFNLNNVKDHETTSGIYLYKLQTQRGYEIRKMIVIK